MQLIKLLSILLVLNSAVFARTALEALDALDTNIATKGAAKAMLTLAMTGKLSEEGARIIGDNPPKIISHGFRKATQNEKFNGTDIFDFMRAKIEKAAKQFITEPEYRLSFSISDCNI